MRLARQAEALRATLFAKDEVAAKLATLELAKLGRTGAFVRDQQKREEEVAQAAVLSQEAAIASESYYRNLNITCESHRSFRSTRSPGGSPRTSSPRLRRLSLTEASSQPCLEKADDMGVVAGSATEGAANDEATPEDLGGGEDTTRRLLFDTSEGGGSGREPTDQTSSGRVLQTEARRRLLRPQSTSTPPARPPTSTVSSESSSTSRASTTRRSRSFTLLKGLPSLHSNIKSETQRSDPMLIPRLTTPHWPN